MIETLVTIVHIGTCLALILAILLQSGKGGGVSAAFGGGAGQALGQRGATTVLGRFTGIASAIFMVTSMSLAIFSTSDYRDETLNDIPATETGAKKDKKAKADDKTSAAKDAKAKTGADKADKKDPAVDVKKAAKTDDGSATKAVGAKDTAPKAAPAPAAKPTPPSTGAKPEPATP